MINKIVSIFNRLNSQLRENKKDKERSPKWESVRKKHIQDNPVCAACGGKNHLQVHHINPFHLHPELELDSSNLITLCMDNDSCHLSIGHGGSFKFYNPNVQQDAESFLHKSKSERKSLIAECELKRLPN